MGKEFSLRPDQRLAIRERDDNHCQGCGIFTLCERREPERIPERLNVHHILPRGYSSRVGIDPNFAENLITVCKTFHTGHPTLSIHPDTFQAQMTYQGQKKSGVFPDAYQRMSERRVELLDNRQIYWNNMYDRQLTVQAVKLTQLKQREGWVFPR